MAGVTINFVLGEGGILDMAKEAAEKTNQAIANEQGDIANLAGDIQNLLGEGTSVDRTGINIGDYIDYKPDKFEDEVAPTYSANELGSTYTGATSNKDIQQDRDIKWQVLKKYDDGSIDIIGTPTSQKVYFNGATGYNNGVYILNDICEKLYSREADGIKARSVNIKDFEDAETPIGTEARETYINNQLDTLNGETTYIQSVDKANKTVTWQNSISWYPNLYAEENGSGTTDNGVIKSGGLKVYESKKKNGIPVITSTDAEDKQKTNAKNLTTTYTYYLLEINETNYGESSKVLIGINEYWLASRYVISDNYQAGFGLRGAGTDNKFGGRTIFMSNGHMRSDQWGNSLRPMVHLGSNVQIKTNKSALNPDTPHEIARY